MTGKQISPMDKEHLAIIRRNVSSFMVDCAKQHDHKGALVLDVAPQDHEGAAPYFKQSKVQTLDIDPGSGATYIADLCMNNEKLIPSDQFDYVVCTEVLEHTLRPFDAVQEIKRILRPGGLAFITAPFNFRIHGPLPDCWRFTEHGLRALFHGWDIIELKSIEKEDRFLMPIHYTMTVKKIG